MNITEQTAWNARGNHTSGDPAKLQEEQSLYVFTAPWRPVLCRPNLLPVVWDIPIDTGAAYTILRPKHWRTVLFMWW